MKEETQGGRRRHAEDNLLPRTLLKPLVSNICAAKVALKCDSARPRAETCTLARRIVEVV